MDQYKITLNGLSPLLMHNDNLTFSEKLTAWRKAPENKEFSSPGDDRTPPWTWIGYLYTNGEHVGISSDNLMTMLREGGAKVHSGRGKETYKKHTQSGIMIDQIQWDVMVNGKKILVKDIEPLQENRDFIEHIKAAEKLGFELMVKRAKIGQSKHIRVRPMFRNWSATGSLTVIDSEISGITQEILQIILNQAGAVCGLCDWRPSSPSSGTFGKFEPFVEAM